MAAGDGRLPVTDAEAAANGGRWVGRPIRRVEDARHLTGTASFVDDIRRPGLLSIAVVRSPHGAARITGIDTAAALETPCVRHVVTADDLGDLEPLVPRLDRPEFVAVEMPLLARDRVRHTGEPVALVLADTPHAAEDGAERVAVAYDPGPAVTSIDAALADDAPTVHDEGNVLLDVDFHDDPGLDAALDDAALVLEETFDSARLTALPMEGRACLAEWDDRDQRLTLWTSTQVPHLVRTTVAALLRMPEHRLRVVAPDVGGGFGQKCVVAREEALTCVAARLAGGPVKWVEDRQENLVSGYQGHEQRFHVRAGFDADGRITAVAADILCDVGAYSTHPFTCGVEPLMAATELLGPYAVRCYRARARAVASNKAPMAPYRGVSRPQMVLAMERLLQKAALRLDLDPVEIRRRNLIPQDAFPWTGPGRARHRPRQLSRGARDLRGRARHEGLRRAPAHGPRRGPPARPRDRLLRRADRVRDRGVQPAQDGGHAGLRQRARADGPVGRGHRLRRHLGPRAGAPDDARPGRGRPSRPRPDRDRGPPERHRRDAVRVGHLRQPVDGRRRRRDPPRRRRARRPPPPPRGPSARGHAGRRRPAGRPRGRARFARPGPARTPTSRASPTSRRRSSPRARRRASRSTPRSTRPGRSPTRPTAASSRSTPTPARSRSSATSSPRTAA